MYLESSQNQTSEGRTDLEDLFGEPISTYTRAQAIEDGVIVDVSEMAREADFSFPVTVTSRVWAEIVTPDPRARPNGQSESGRLWDVLWMARYAIRNLRDHVTNECCFKLYVIQKAAQRRLVTLKAHCGPGDQGKPVITIMLPDED